MQNNNQNKIILVNYTGRKGGGPIFAYEMTRGLLENGVRVVAIISNRIDNLADWKNLQLEKLVCIETYSNKINYITNSILFNIRQKKKILKNLGNYDFTAIYCPMNCQWSKKINELFPNVPVYETLHDPIPHSGERWYLKKFKPSKNTKKLIVLSEQFKENVERIYNKPTLWIPHGRFSYYKEKYFKGYKNSDKISFLFFGRIEEYKGLRVLAQAFSLLSDSLKHDFTLTIAGRGDWEKFKDDFEGIKNLNIVNKWLDDSEVNELFSLRKTITILPYLDATQSGVIPIAQEYESPIIASNVGGLKEQIKDGETGFLFPVGDGYALADCIRKIDEDLDMAAKIAKTAYFKLTDLNWSSLANKFLSNL